MNAFARDITEHYGLNNRSLVRYFGAIILVQAVLGAIDVLLNLYILALGFDEGFAGVTMFVKLLVTGAVCIPASFLCSRLGVVRTLAVASVGLGMGLLTVALTANPVLLTAGAVLIGSAVAIQAVGIPVFLIENSDPQLRQNVFSLNFSLMMFAGMAGSGLSGYLPRLWAGEATGLAGALSVYGLLALLSALPLALIKPRGPGKRSCPGSALGELKSVLGKRDLRRLLFHDSLLGFGAGFILPLFNIFMRNQLGASPSQIGIIMSGGQIATAVGGLLVPLVVNCLGQVPTVVLLRLASIPFLLVIANANYLYGLGAAYFLRTTLMNMTNPVKSKFIMELAGQERVAMSSLLNSANTITGAISVLASGWLMATYSYGLPYYLTCGLYGVTTCLFWFWFRPRKQQAASSARANQG